MDCEEYLENRREISHSGDWARVLCICEGSSETHLTKRSCAKSTYKNRIVVFLMFSSEAPPVRITEHK